MSKSLQITLLVFLLFLIVGNPSQKSYLNKIAKDYGTVHHGLEMSAESLLKMGSLNRNSYLLFSTCTYTFGNISVTYLGVGFLKLQVATSTSDQQNKNQNV